MTLPDYDEALGDACECGNSNPRTLDVCLQCGTTECNACRDFHMSRECVEGTFGTGWCHFHNWTKDPEGRCIRCDMEEKAADDADAREYFLTRIGIGWAIVVGCCHFFVAMAVVS